MREPTLERVKTSIVIFALLICACGNRENHSNNDLDSKSTNQSDCYKTSDLKTLLQLMDEKNINELKVECSLSGQCFDLIGRVAAAKRIELTQPVLLDAYFHFKKFEK